MTLHRRALFILLSLWLGLAGAAAAQPAQAVVWSGFPPGGLGDQVTRPLLERLKTLYPGTLILDGLGLRPLWRTRRH